MDGTFLHPFLSHLNHVSLGKISEASNDIINMEQIIETRDVSHRDTCLNLLGWVYKQQSHTQKAIDCFKRSLKISPLHNAAHMHLKETEPEDHWS